MENGAQKTGFTTMRRQVADLQLTYPVERPESFLLEAGEVVVVEAQDLEAAQR
jgi:hypothetical protein